MQNKGYYRLKCTVVSFFNNYNMNIEKTLNDLKLLKKQFNGTCNDCQKDIDAFLSDFKPDIFGNQVFDKNAIDMCFFEIYQKLRGYGDAVILLLEGSKTICREIDALCGCSYLGGADIQEIETAYEQSKSILSHASKVAKELFEYTNQLYYLFKTNEDDNKVILSIAKINCLLTELTTKLNTYIII